MGCCCSKKKSRNRVESEAVIEQVLELVQEPVLIRGRETKVNEERRESVKVTEWDSIYSILRRKTVSQ